MRRSDVLWTYEPDNLFERQVRMREGYAGASKPDSLKDFFRLDLFNFSRVVRELMLTKCSL